MAKILLVEDDNFFRAAIKDSLEIKGHNIFEAPNGKVARDILAASDFEIVISDVEMPFLNGIDLLEWIKKEKSIPFILMTGFSNLLESKTAYDLGAEGFLTKPFKNKELIDLVQNILSKDAIAATPAETKTETEADVNLESQYCKVSIDEFVIQPKISFDIFIRLSAAKYLKIAHKNTILQVENLITYKEKGITHLYILREDFGSLVGFNLQLTNLIKDNTNISKEKKINFIKYTGETILENCFINGLDDMAFKEAKSFLDATINVISESDSMVDLLNLLNKHSNFIYAQSVGVAMYSVMIATKMGINSSQTMFKLCMAGMFHDIGKKEIQTEILEKARILMSSQERVSFESHVTRGIEILEDLRTVPSDVIQMIYEHHEDCVGQGYPRAISKNELHPLSKILILANRFADITIRSASLKQPMTAPIAVYHLETTGLERFDKNVFEALKALVKK